MRQIVAIEDNCQAKDEWLRVEWNLGKRCNYDCSYCGPNLHNNFSPHMSVDVFNSTVTQLMCAGDRQAKKVKLALTGGEPFANPKILDMLKSAKDKGVYKISVTTNGSVPLKKYELASHFVDYFIISYHFEFAYHERVINTILGLEDICKTHRAHGKNSQMHVHLMFLPGHLTHCKEIISLLSSNNISYAVRRIRPQYDPVTGTHIAPYKSGSLGVTAGNLTIPVSTDVEYYSDEELAWLGSI